MNVQQTSLFSYRKLKDAGKLSYRQVQVKELLEDTRVPLNNRQISEMLQLPINTITPRVKELRVLGIIEKAGIRTDAISNRAVLYWKICND